jgi:L-threonylcarbamoyladenylate synthase
MSSWRTQVFDLHIQRAVDVMRLGGVIAYPTEAVWGLGCDPGNEAAVRRLLEMKDRAVSKGLILVTGQMAQVMPALTTLTETQAARVLSSWPGPVTWLIPDKWETPRWIKGDFHSIALRVSDHPVIAALSARFGGPLISTSANPSGRPAALSLLRVRQYFGAQLGYIVPGELGGLSKPSQIIDVSTTNIVRR